MFPAKEAPGRRGGRGRMICHLGLRRLVGDGSSSDNFETTAMRSKTSRYNSSVLDMIISKNTKTISNRNEIETTGKTYLE